MVSLVERMQRTHGRIYVYGVADFWKPRFPWGGIVTARSSQRGARPPDARGAQEWRDAEWTSCKLRYVDELDAQGGDTDECCTFSF